MLGAVIVPGSVLAAPSTTLQGRAEVGRALRATVDGAAIVRVVWQRCPRPRCARARGIGRDTGYRIRPQDAGAWLGAEVIIRQRRIVRTPRRTTVRWQVRTVHTGWRGPVRTPSGAPAPVASGDATALGAPLAVAGSDGARWSVTTVGWSADATLTVGMIDPLQPALPAGWSWAMARVKVGNSGFSTQTFSPTGLRLVEGERSWGVGAVADPERLAGATLGPGRSAEGTVYWQIPDDADPDLQVAFDADPARWQRVALD